MAEANTTPDGQNPLESIVDRTLRTINDADASAAAVRVQELRMRQRFTSDDALVQHLIKQKALQTGMVGAVTSATALIPGFGTLAAFTIGVATDVGVTLRLQSELVLEIAAAHGHTLSPHESRNALMLVTGINVGTERLVNQASRKLAEKAVERFAGRAIVKTIPFLGIAIAAGANLLTTYVVGRRADAYFRLGPEAVGDWQASFRALTGLDERKLLGWLGEVLTVFGQKLAAGGMRLQVATTALAKRTGSAVVDRIKRRSLPDNQA